MANKNTMQDMTVGNPTSHILIFFFVPRFGFVAACTASPVAWILADAFLIPAYFLVVRHLKQYILREGADSVYDKADRL